jgi:hypothetical protein
MGRSCLTRLYADGDTAALRTGISRWIRTVRSGHCEIQTGGCRLEKRDVIGLRSWYALALAESFTRVRRLILPASCAPSSL